MNENYVFPSIVEALPNMLNEIERNGPMVGSRVGTTKELTHVGITLLDPQNREILVPHRKPNLAAQIAETMWVLAGRDDIAWLENYLPRVRDFSDDGETWRAGYGARLRRWEDHAHAKPVDQWRWLVQHLSDQPESRRAVMSIWDPVTDTQDGKDIPCNDWLSFLGRNGRLDLHVAIRSNDVIWGWSGINQFEWSALLEITAGMTGMEMGSLHFSTTSFHLYDHHFAKAEKIRTSQLPLLDQMADSPRFDASAVNHDFDTLQALLDRWFQVEYDIRTGSPLVQHYVDTFPEPMLRSWLRIIQWWWGGARDWSFIVPLEGTRLYEATKYAMKPKKPQGVTITAGALTITAGALTFIGEMSSMTFDASPGRLFPMADDDFIEGLCRLHIQKEKAYGGSWKKRGELFSILPNVGRKVDRLGTGGATEDETSADTAGDLFVYLAKYVTWLNEHYSIDGPDDSDNAKSANEIMRTVHQGTHGLSVPSTKDLVDRLIDLYDEVLPLAEAKDPRRVDLVNEMLAPAYMLARTLWSSESRSESLDEYRGADAD